MTVFGGPPAPRWRVTLTEVRPLVGERDRRDERQAPERVVRAVHAGSAEAAGRIAHAFGSLGMVRAGRLRVKVIAPDGVRRSGLVSGTDAASASRGLDGA